MKKTTILVLCLFLIAMFNYAQDQPEINGFTFLKQYDSTEQLPDGLKKKLARKTYIYAPFEAEKLGYHDEVSKRLSSKLDLIDGKHFFAVDAYESGILWIGFYHKEKGLLNDYELGFDAKIQLSENEEFVTIFNMMGNQIYIFRKDGSLVFKGNARNITNSLGVLNNIFVDNEGKNLWINLQYELFKIDIESLEVTWKTKIPSWRIYNLYVYTQKGILLAKADHPYGHEVKSGAEFRLTIYSLKSGVEKATIDNIANMKFLEDRLYLLINKKWYAYEIN